MNLEGVPYLRLRLPHQFDSFSQVGMREVSQWRMREVSERRFLGEVSEFRLLTLLRAAPPPCSPCSPALDLQEFLHALGIKDASERKLEEQEKLRRDGPDALGVEERYRYFTAYLSGLDDFDRSQHHRHQESIHAQYTSSTVRFPRDIHVLSRAEQTKILTNNTSFHFAVRGEVDYSHIPMSLDSRLARGNLQSATAMRMQTKNVFDISIACKHLPRRPGSEVDPLVILVCPPCQHECTSEVEQQKVTLDYILGRHWEALDGHLEQRTERLENNSNPRFRRRFEWEVLTLSRHSEMHNAYERESMIFIVYDDPDPFGREGARGLENIIGVLQCSLGEIVQASQGGASLTRPLRNLMHSSGYADPMSHGQIVLHATENHVDDLLTQIKAHNPKALSPLAALTEPSSLTQRPSSPEGMQCAESEAGSYASQLSARIPAYTPRVTRWVKSLELEFLCLFDLNAAAMLQQARASHGEVSHGASDANGLVASHSHSSCPIRNTSWHLTDRHGSGRDGSMFHAHMHAAGHEGGELQRKEHGVEHRVRHTIDSHTFLEFAVRSGVLASKHGVGVAAAADVQHAEMGTLPGSKATGSKSCPLGMMSRKDIEIIFDEVAGSTEYVLDRQQLIEVFCCMWGWRWHLAHIISARSSLPSYRPRLRLLSCGCEHTRVWHADARGHDDRYPGAWLSISCRSSRRRARVHRKRLSNAS